MNKEFNKEYGKVGEVKQEEKKQEALPAIKEQDYPEWFDYIYTRLPLDFKKRLLESLRVHFYYQFVNDNAEKITVDSSMNDERQRFFESMWRLKTYLIKDIAKES